MVKAQGSLKNVPAAIDIGGLEEQIQEIKETVELPLVHPEYYEEMGITAPKGVILFGEPGT
ncbi:unnamed protein product, partial [Gongylonema pulchrum]|uniref:ATPase_AAA_core domain-containing protein n=1 Tax=Gongylonema pulchrum TaxID=637853 RepID=A0A183DHC1_9BILA